MKHFELQEVDDRLQYVCKTCKGEIEKYHYKKKDYCLCGFCLCEEEFAPDKIRVQEIKGSYFTARRARVDLINKVDVKINFVVPVRELVAKRKLEFSTINCSNCNTSIQVRHKDRSFCCPLCRFTNEVEKEDTLYV